MAMLSPSLESTQLERWEAKTGRSAADRCRRPFRVLSLDGGGVRGVLTATLLMRLQQHFPALMSNFDLIVGSSTGGMIALLLASGYTPRDIRDIYRHYGPAIFTTTTARSMSFFNAKYDGKEKHKVVSKFMGPLRLGDLPQFVIITALKLDGVSAEPGHHTFFPTDKWRPALFSNIPKTAHTEVEPDNNLLSSEAAMRTTAAPTYFPVHSGYTDGGLFANNPALMAIARTRNHSPHLRMRDFRVLALGAGNFKYNINVQDADWGLRQWAPHLINIVLDSSSLSAEMACSMLLREHWHRLDPRLPEIINLDSTKDIPNLIEFANSVDIQPTIRFLRKHWHWNHDNEDEDGDGDDSHHKAKRSGSDFAESK